MLMVAMVSNNDTMKEFYVQLWTR